MGEDYSAGRFHDEGRTAIADCVQVRSRTHAVNYQYQISVWAIRSVCVV
jgi:hypothetical protein